MSRARDLSKLGNPNVIKADENSVGFGTQVAGNHANADSSLISAGIITATAYYGDGSNLEGVASAGLGTAVDDTKDSIGQNIYFTNAELSINENTTVNAPDTSNIAYTQYQQVTVESGSELIISDGDSFIPDVLGIGTALQASTAGAGNGLFGTVFADNIENAAGRGGPNFPLGITVAGVSTLSGNVSIGGTLTYEDVTNVDSVGMVTARNGIDITGGNLNAASNLILKVDGGEKVRITSAGNLGINDNNPANQLVVKAPGGSGHCAAKVLSGDASTALFLQSIQGSEGRLGVESNHPLALYAGTAERLRIGTAGQLGINGANYGTSGQVLTSGGASAVVQWADVSAGLWSTLSSGTVTSGNAGTITNNGISNTYHMYKIVFYAAMNGQGSLGIDITTDGGSSWTGGGWTYCYSGREHNSNWQGDHSGVRAFLVNAVKDRYWGEITFGDTQNSSTHPSFNFVGGFENDSTIWGGTITTNMTYPVNTAFNGIRWYSQSADMSNVKWALLGSTLS